MRVEVRAGQLRQVAIDTGLSEPTVRQIAAALARAGWDAPALEPTLPGCGKVGANTLVVVEDDASSPRALRTKARSTMPADFCLTDETIVWTRRQLGDDSSWLPVYKTFLSHHQAKGSKFADWQAAWRTWVCKEKQWGRRTNNSSKSSSSRDQAARTAPLP